MNLSPNLCPGEGREVAASFNRSLMTCPVCGRTNLTIENTHWDGDRYISTVVRHRAKLAEPGDIGDTRFTPASDGVDWDYRWHGRQA